MMKVVIVQSIMIDSGDALTVISLNSKLASECLWGSFLHLLPSPLAYFLVTLIDSLLTQHVCMYTGRAGGIVRLLHRRLAERALIKGYRGLVVDIAFANSDIDVLASLDDSGMLLVHRIELDQANHVMYPLLHLLADLCSLVQVFLRCNCRK